MTGTEFVFVNSSGDVDVKASLPTIRQHVMQDFLRRQRETENDQQELSTISELGTMSKNRQMAHSSRKAPSPIYPATMPSRLHRSVERQHLLSGLRSGDNTLFSLNELHVKTDAEPALRLAAAEQMRPSMTDHASMVSLEATPLPSPTSGRSPKIRCQCQSPIEDGPMVQCSLCAMYSHSSCASLSGTANRYFCHLCARVSPISTRSSLADVSYVLSRPTKRAGGPHPPKRSIDRSMAPEFRDDGIDVNEVDSDDEAGQKYERSMSPSDSHQSWSASDTGSRTSSGRPMDDLDDLDKYLLNTESSRLRHWLLERSELEPFLQHLQREVTYRQHESSTPHDQPADISSKSSSKSSSASPSTSSSIPTTLSGETSKGNKRRRDDPGEQDEQPQKKRRVPEEEAKPTSTPRLACFYNKHDPMMYRSNASTLKKFEICATHDFQNMNKLYEHLKRVHSGQALQCPRCTRTDFRTPEDLLAHQTAAEACIWIPLTQVKRIKWMSDDQRLALQSEVAKELRGRPDEEKWKFAYKKLFPDVSPDDIPSPFFQDPVISIVSFIVDHYERRLRNDIQQSSDLPDLESRIPAIRGQFLAQYGLSVDGLDNGPPQDQSMNLPSLSGSLDPSPEDDTALLARWEATMNESWPQLDIMPPSDYLVSIHDELDNIGTENDMLSFTESGTDPFGNTSMSYSSEVL